MARLYADEDVSLLLVAALRQRGLAIRHSTDYGHANRAFPDSQVLSAAAAEGAIVLTHNIRDFRRLHRQTQAHAGIVGSRRELDVDQLAARLAAALAAAGELAGRMIVVTRTGRPLYREDEASASG